MNAHEVAEDVRRQRDAVWHNHLSTGESVRTVRTAGRTAAKVAALGSMGNTFAGSGGLRGSTVSEYTRRISRSAERQALGGMAVAAARLALLPPAYRGGV